MHRFTLPVRVYIEDTDAGGIVYYANYLRYLERARTEWLRACGVELDAWQRRHGRLFVVRSVSLEYRRPAHLDEQLQVSAVLESLHRASLQLQQQVHRGGELLLDASVRLACIDADTHIPVAIPGAITEAINRERDKP